ncbi:MAG: hypothetical protein JNN01_06415 [Opitutaceae bacterium]|nr:hypothetical protein [Opitutaceae bacterium]
MKIVTYILLALGALPLARYGSLFHEMTHILSKFRDFDVSSLARVTTFLAALGTLGYPLVYLFGLALTIWQFNAGNRDLALASASLPIACIIVIVLLVVVAAQGTKGSF